MSVYVSQLALTTALNPSRMHPQDSLRSPDRDRPVANRMYLAARGFTTATFRSRGGEPVRLNPVSQPAKGGWQNPQKAKAPEAGAIT